MADYRVQLDTFSGPMDLLLYLVRRNEVDIVRLPIARITVQFLQFLDVLQLMDLDLIGDFVVMASSLIEIKSRQVLPRAEEEVAEELPLTDDPCSELIQQLANTNAIAMRQLALEHQASEWLERYPRLSDDRPTVGKDPSADSIKEVELWDLVSALGRVIQKKAVEQTSSIRYDDTPIAVYVDHIGVRVRAAGRVAFSDFFEGTNLRSKIVGIFLAILELLRHHGFRAEQSIEYGEIFVLPPVIETGSVADASDDQATSDPAGNQRSCFAEFLTTDAVNGPTRLFRDGFRGLQRSTFRRISSVPRRPLAVAAFSATGFCQSFRICELLLLLGSDNSCCDGIVCVRLCRGGCVGRSFQLSHGIRCDLFGGHLVTRGFLPRRFGCGQHSVRRSQRFRFCDLLLKGRDQLLVAFSERVPAHPGQFLRGGFAGRFQV